MKKNGYHKVFIRLLIYKPWMFIVSVLLNIVIFSYSAALAYFVREVLNTVAGDTAGGKSVLPQVTIFFAGVLGVSLIRMAAITACALMDRIQDFHYENILRNNILKIIYKKDNIKNMAGRSEKAFEILDDDVPACAFPSQLLSEVSGFVVYSLIAMASLLIINWKVTIYIFIPLSLAILIINTASKKIKGNRKVNREIHSKVSETISDTANLVQTIKISNSQDSVLKHYEKLNTIRLGAVLKDTLFESSLQAVLSSTVYIGTAVMMLVVARSMMRGEFPIGDFSMFVIYLGTLASCVDRIVELVSLRKQAEVSYDRIIELVGEESENELTSHCELSAFKAMEKFQYETMERTPLKELQVKNLTFGHDDRNGIYDVSFTLKPGEVLAVAGGVGSGKSTLLNVLMGVTPKDSGKVIWNGREIKQHKEFFIPPNVAYTPQNGKMYSHTIGENLLLGKDPCEEEISQALYNAVLEEEVSEMENGLHTQAGSGGSRLSGGQRQRLALARMFLHDAELYVMDDSTSAIDTETEKEFWSRFEKNIAKRKFACIIASNKRHVLQRADKIIFMKNGHVAGWGKAEELSAYCEEFASIYVG
ncbi:MAG: transporter ATP-binding protein [Clostridia bacterium]|jgi:ATP-binding cassette subfamily B protein|nr:transporter ATP-binding protein [Clostridia bacterium]